MLCARCKGQFKADDELSAGPKKGRKARGKGGKGGKAGDDQSLLGAAELEKEKQALLEEISKRSEENERQRDQIDKLSNQVKQLQQTLEKEKGAQVSKGIYAY